MFKLKYILPLTLLLFSRCADKENTIPSFNWESSKQRLLQSEIALSNIVINPSRIVFCDDFLFVSHSKTSKLLSVYELKTGKTIGEFVGKGRGPQELLSIQNMSKNERLKTLTLYDVITSKFIVCNIQALKDGYLETISEGDSGFNFVKEQVVYTNDSCITYLGQKSRLIFQNNNGQMVDSIGDYIIFNSNEEPMWLPQIYKGQIAYNEKTGQFAIFNKLTDKIEFYKDKKLTNIISGPDGFKEMYRIVRVGGGEALGHYSDKTRIAYERVTSNSKFILALYSGATFGEDGTHHNIIFKFDWNGKLIESYKLDKCLISFDVDWDNNIIYGLNTEEVESVVLKYQL